MEAVRALAGALAARGTNEATALKQEICYLRLGPRVSPFSDLATVLAAPTPIWPLGAQVISLTAHTCVLRRYLHESSSISYME